MCFVAKIYDIRPIDWNSGLRLPVPRDEWETCQECGNKHARVYELSDGRTVGRNCMFKLVLGFTPKREAQFDIELVRVAAKAEAEKLFNSTYRDWLPTVKLGYTDQLYSILSKAMPGQLFTYGAEHVVDLWISHHRSLGTITSVNGYLMFKTDQNIQ